MTSQEYLKTFDKRHKKLKFEAENLKPNESKIWKQIPIESIKASKRIEYDSKVGLFYYNLKNGSQKVAGYVNKNGYRVLSVNGVKLYAHRLAYAWIYNTDIPFGYMVDHVNWNRDWNVPNNLRLVLRSHNILNQKLKEGKEHANIYIREGKKKTTYYFKMKYLGKQHFASFDSLEDAIYYRDSHYRHLGLEDLKFQTYQSIDKKVA